jgi:hypothetical protein
MYGTQALYYLSQFPIKSTEQNIVEFVTRFGALMIYAFIIAASPFSKQEDKDRIIYDWIQHAIPVNKMFQLFIATFTSDNKKFDGSESIYELDEKTIDNLCRAIKTLYPDIYDSLEKANWIR